MAHADYHCCAICDSKMDYSRDARTKEDLCTDCTRAIVTAGFPIFDGEELIAALDANTPGLVDALEAIGFSTCYYGNPVDEAFKRAKEVKP